MDIKIQSIKIDLLLSDCDIVMNKIITESKYSFKYHNTSKAKLVIREYVERVIVDNSSVTIQFKVNVPDNDTMELKPLTVTIDRKQMYKKYRPVI